MIHSSQLRTTAMTPTPAYMRAWETGGNRREGCGPIRCCNRRIIIASVVFFFPFLS